MSSDDAPNRICVGRIAGAHGVQGLIRITSYTEEPMDVAAYGPVTDEDGERMFELEAKRMAKTQVLVRIKGVMDRNAAEALNGMRLYVSRDVLPTPADDEFYWEDLVGLAAETVDGTSLGSVLSVQEFGAGEMLEIGERSGGTTLVPFTRDIVPQVDLQAGKLVVDPPPGLLEPVTKDDPENSSGKKEGRTMTTPRWTAKVLTLFPEMFPGPLGFSLAGRALDQGLWALETTDIREFACDKHATVDDAPFGGGPGMVMRADVVGNALEAARSKTRPIYLTPRGRQLDQDRVRALAAEPEITILCGRFEGVDERVLDAHGLEQVSLGDFVLSGGEPAAITLIDACVRLLPGVIGKTESLTDESFEEGLLEYPHYTRPVDWQGHKVPELLLSGHHEKIKTWRREAAEKITQERRPDLWNRYQERHMAIKD